MQRPLPHRRTRAAARRDRPGQRTTGGEPVDDDGRASDALDRWWRGPLDRRTGRSRRWPESSCRSGIGRNLESPRRLQPQVPAVLEEIEERAEYGAAPERACEIAV